MIIISYINYLKLYVMAHLPCPKPSLSCPSLTVTLQYLRKVGSETLGHSPKLTQLVSSKARIQIQLQLLPTRLLPSIPQRRENRLESWGNGRGSLFQAALQPIFNKTRLPFAATPL